MSSYIKNYSGRLNRLKARAQYKKVPFSLSLKDLEKIYTVANCYYCNCLIRPGRKQIDRLIPIKGYTLENCVMSCRLCNTMKGSMVRGDKKYERILSIIKKL